MDLESLPEIRRITFAEGMMRGTKVSCTNAFSYGVDDNLIYQLKKNSAALQRQT